MEPYLTGHVRHTIYGPSEQLSEKRRRYRAKNHEEFTLYCNKVEQSGGFDVDGCTGYLPGEIVPIELTSNWWDIAISAAHFAVSQYNLDKDGPDAVPNLKLTELVKANMQGIAGVMYYLTLTAVDSTTQVESIYRAKVSDTAGMPTSDRLRLESFEIFTTGDKTAEEMRLEIDNKFKELAKKGFRRPSIELDMDQEEFKEPTRRELAAKGFLILVRELRNENPRWKYARAKRIASRKWKSLGSIGRCIYEMRARNEIVEKKYGVYGR